MSRQHPDRDSLTAYLEEVLSIDATQWIEQHLGGCAECRDKLEEERSFLGALHGLSSVEPPTDFTEGVMARVAQYPAYQAAPDVPWRRIGVRIGSAAAVLFLLFSFVGWVIMQNAPAQGAAMPAEVSTWVMSAKDVFFDLSLSAWRTAQAGWELFKILGTVFFEIIDFFRGQNLAVQLALLLLTVGFNYWVTRLVLSYQRRQ